jgi:hypothetical protein
MGLKTMSLLAGATVSASGGTAQVFATDGITIPNGLHLIVPADADYQTRRSATVKYKPPVLEPKTMTFSKDKKTISYSWPCVQADGSLKFAVLRVEREVPVTMSAADCVLMNLIGAQLLIAAETAGFWATGDMT